MDLLSLIFGEPTTNEGRIASELAKAMEGYKLMGRATDYALPNTEMEDLDLQDRRLSVMQRRRALGLPMDSDDLEEANNTGSSFLTRMRDLAGFRTVQAIPDMTQGVGTAISHVRLPWEGSSNMARSAFGALSAIGGKNVSNLRRIY